MANCLNDFSGSFSLPSCCIFSTSIIVSYGGGGISKPIASSYFGGKSLFSACVARGFYNDKKETDDKF